LGAQGKLKAAGYAGSPEQVGKAQLSAEIPAQQ
jgi:hypothetical protein